MTTEKSTTKEFKPSPVAYKKSTLRSDYMAYPSNAVAFSKVGENKGKLILALGLLNKIGILDPDTGYMVREYGEEYGTAGGLDDVTEGPDGTLYFTRLGRDKLGYIRPDGSIGDIQVKPSSNSIAVSRDGKWLYYGLCIADDQLWRIELENGVPKKGGIHELVEQSPGWSNSMDPSDDGYIYSVTNFYGELRKINPETKEITVIYDNLEFPSSVEVNDATGICYITEFHLGYITRVDPKIKDPRKAKRVIALAPPCTDNAGVQDGPHPRIFGSSFAEDIIFEAYENGDPIRIVHKGGMIPMSIQILKGPHGDRIFIKDFARVQEWFPAEGRYETLAWGNFWAYAQDDAFDKGVPRINPKKTVTWTASFEDYLTIPFGKVMHLTSEGHLLLGGNFGERDANRLALFDVNERKVLRLVRNLDYVPDAIMVGQDIYAMEGKKDEYPHAPSIKRITPDDKREIVFTGKNFGAFAHAGDVAFAADMEAGTIYQVVKDGKWLKQPTVLVSGLKGPQGMTIGNDGNLLVLEDNVGINGRMLKVDLKTKEITVLAEGLGVNIDLNKRDWKFLRPRSIVAQASDGAIYFTETGFKMFSVLRAQQ
jgi:sugar lactone lactonase YvrE